MTGARPFTLDRLVRLGGAALLLAGVGWLLYHLRGVLAPFFIALLLAYMLDPWVARVRMVVKNHVLAVLLTLLLVLLAAVALVALITPQVDGEVDHFSRLMTDRMPLWKARAADVPWVHDALMRIDGFDLRTYLTGENLEKVVQRVLPGFWSGMNSVFGWMAGLVGVFMTMIYLVFILIDEEDVKANWSKMIPVRYRRTVADLAVDLGQAMERYFRGQFKIAVILAIVYIIGFSIVGLPMAVVLGLIAGALSMIPYLVLLSVPLVLLSAALMALDQGGAFWPPMVGALVVYGVGQVLEGLVLTPRIQGRNTGLRPEHILLALSIWGSLFGLLGMVIALPLTSVMIRYYRRLVGGDPDEPPTAPVEEVSTE